MKCEEVHRFLDMYLDGELDSARQLELEEHLATCSDCQSLLEERQEFRTFFAASVPGYKAPPELAAKILTTVRREQAKPRVSLFWQPWVYAAAVVAVAIFLALKILHPDSESEFSRQAVLRHSYSLSTQHLVDVASPNPAVVKPWLTARLDFAPPVVGSPTSGYSLLGGRLDTIQNRSVATMVYKHGNDILTLFCWPPKKEKLSESNRSMEGYQVYTRSTAKCNYVIVSKLSDQAMDEFADSFQAHIRSGEYF
jgi:mycothiol system anti-sigma-R factor